MRYHTAQTLEFLLVSLLECYDTAHTLEFLLVLVCYDTAQTLEFLLIVTVLQHSPKLGVLADFHNVSVL